LGVLVLAAGVALCLFPGQRLGLALTLGSGIGTARLQARIDALEERAIRGAPLSASELELLSDFYRTLATGAKLSIVVRQTGRLMDHYLDGSGAAYRLDPQIFRDNLKVQDQLFKLKLRAERQPCGSTFQSPRFYMPDSSQLDSVFGLYWGELSVTRRSAADGRCVSHVRAEVPWHWPSYASLKAKHGRYHAESFPLPNLKSLLLGSEHALFVDNGLGEHLAQVGLARPFVAFAEWEESH
jgi:hypothetical protein